jgi:hypothetical protein
MGGALLQPKGIATASMTINMAGTMEIYPGLLLPRRLSGKSDLMTT